MKDTYYKERVNPRTSTVTETISIFLTWLFTAYGDINHATIKEGEDHASKMVYNLRNTTTDVFEPIQELE